MLDLSTLKLGFIGFGNMAGAMADGFLRAGVLPGARLGKWRVADSLARCVREPLGATRRKRGAL